MSATYDTIGINYANLRQPDERIAALIDKALGSATTVLNVGAGSGSYEPADREITALEPSLEMINQRRTSNATIIQGCAEDLPFDDNSFDASMASLTVHHWRDQPKGLRELRRVTRGPIVILTFDPNHKGFWLLDYLPELVTLDHQQMPQLTNYETWLGPVDISVVPIPHDCSDGFLYAYWRRPAAYLDPRVRSAMSSFWAIGDVSEKLDKLAVDLDSGAWDTRYGDLLRQEAYDGGYRLVVTKPRGAK